MPYRFWVIATSFLLLSVSAVTAQRKPATTPEQDSLLAKRNEILKLISGTRLTLIDCNDVTVCRALYNHLAQMGFKNSMIEAGAAKAQYLSMCEVVTIKPDINIVSRKIEDLTLEFQFCGGRTIKLTSTRKLSASYNYISEIEDRLSKEFKQLMGFAKPQFMEENMLKLQRRPTGWTEDSLKSYLRRRPKTSIEGTYEEMSGNLEKQDNLRFAVVKKGAGFDLIYLSGHSNINDRSAGDLKGHLDPTGAADTYKLLWIYQAQEEKRNLFASIAGGMLRITLPAKVNVDRTTGNVSGEIQGMFIKVALNEEAQTDGTATGFAITSTGRIVTNYHVIEGAQKVFVRGINGNFGERVLAYVAATDKKVFVLGFPAVNVMGSELKVTDGLVSSRSGVEGDLSSYQISAPIQPGNSGSPVFDEEGNLVGVANAGLRYLFENVSYAIKSSYLNNFLNEAEVKVSAPRQNTLKALSTADKVKQLRKHVYIIEVEK